MISAGYLKLFTSLVYYYKFTLINSIFNILEVRIPEVMRKSMIDIFLRGVIKAVLWYSYYTIKSDSFDVELVDVLEGLEAKSIAFSAFIYFP